MLFLIKKRCQICTFRKKERCNLCTSVLAYERRQIGNISYFEQWNKWKMLSRKNTKTYMLYMRDRFHIRMIWKSIRGLWTNYLQWNQRKMFSRKTLINIYARLMSHHNDIKSISSIREIKLKLKVRHSLGVQTGWRRVADSLPFVETC